MRKSGNLRRKIKARRARLLPSWEFLATKSLLLPRGWLISRVMRELDRKPTTSNISRFLLARHKIGVPFPHLVHWEQLYNSGVSEWRSVAAFSRFSKKFNIIASPTE